MLSNTDSMYQASKGFILSIISDFRLSISCFREDLFVTSVSASCAHNNTAIRRWTTLVADVRQINEPFYLIFSDQTYRSYTSCFLTKESRKALLLQLMHVSLFHFFFFFILIMTCDSTKRDIKICMKTIFDGTCHFQKNNTEMFFLEHHISCMRGIFHYFLFFSIKIFNPQMNHWDTRWKEFTW